MENQVKTIYDKVMKYYAGRSALDFQSRTARTSFEESVWCHCKPNKGLANAVMDYANKQLDIARDEEAKQNKLLPDKGSDMDELKKDPD